MSSILTAREQEMICYIWQSCNTVPDVDLEKVASMGGYKTRASANTAYHKLKTKMMAFGNANANANNDAEDGDADADADAEDTPAPVVKKGRGKKAAPVKAEEPETDEDDEPDTITVKSKAKPKAKATKVAAVKAAPVKPAAKGRTTRASLRARKSLAKDESSADEDEAKKPNLELKTGPAKYPKLKNIHVKPTITDVPDDSAAGAEEPAADTNALKRAATESASDDELAQSKRTKIDAEVDDAEIVAEVDAILDAAVEPAATKAVVVSTDPRIESFVVNDTDAVNASAADMDITMTGEDGSGASDVRSDVASAADSNDRDL